MWEQTFFCLFFSITASSSTQHKRTKEGKGLRHYIVWQTGKVPKPNSFFVENTLHNHTHRPQKWHHSFTCLSVSIGSRQQQGKKRQLIYNDRSSSSESYKSFGNVSISTREKQHVRWLSISNRITLHLCTYIYIFTGCPTQHEQSLWKEKLTMFKHRKENKLNNNWSQSLFTEVVARANARYQCEISRFHNSNMRASKLAKHCQCCMGHPVDWMYGTSISTQPQALGYWHRTSETLRSSGHTIPL